jgi:hypothetical protein
MKRFVIAVFFCLMLGSFLASCATAVPEHQRGAYTKRGMPRQAQEQVAPEGGSSQSTPAQTEDEADPKRNPPKSK